jgi:hypothetical protein
MTEHRPFKAGRVQPGNQNPLSTTEGRGQRAVGRRWKGEEFNHGWTWIFKHKIILQEQAEIAERVDGQPRIRGQKGDVSIYQASAGFVLPDHVNAKNFPRLAALSERAMKIHAFASTVPHR